MPPDSAPDGAVGGGFGGRGGMGGLGIGGGGSGGGGDGGGGNTISAAVAACGRGGRASMRNEECQACAAAKPIRCPPHRRQRACLAPRVFLSARTVVTGIPLAAIVVLRAAVKPAPAPMAEAVDEAAPEP